MKAKRVSPARDEDVQITMTASEARRLLGAIRSVSAFVLNDLRDALVEVDISQ